MIEGSRRKSYLDQQKIVATLAQKKGASYSVPNLLEATIGILMHHVSTEKRIYEDEDIEREL